MKPIRIVLSPTHSRPVNMFLGMVLMLAALLLFLALASFHASDPSLNTAADSAVARNWVGIFGAYLSDILMQSLGLTAFLLPLWLGSLGWTWLQSRPGGSPDPPLDGHITRFGFHAGCLWPASVALAVAARCSSGGRGWAAGGRRAGGLFEHSRRLAGCHGVRGLRPLLCLSDRFLGNSRESCGTVGSAFRLARKMA